jgi:hypothetical protein
MKKDRSNLLTWYNAALEELNRICPRKYEESSTSDGAKTSSDNHGTKRKRMDSELYADFDEVEDQWTGVKMDDIEKIAI